MTIAERLNALRDGAGEAWRAHKERAVERRAQRQDPPGVTVPEWLVRAAHFASWVAMASLVYFLWLYTLDIARDRAGNMHLTHAGSWIGDLQFWFPYIIGFAIVSFGIPYTAKIAIPTFMSLRWQGAFWPKLWALIIAAAVSLVVVFGTFVTQGDTLLERDRDAAVAVEGVQQGRAAIQAQIDGEQADLRDMMNNRNSYMAQAANVGAAAWQSSYVAQARQTNDPRLPMIERALGAAQAADARRAHIATLRQQLARAPTVAAVQGTVSTERTSWIADLIGRIEGIRAILLSFVMDIVALMMPWIALRLEQARNAQLGMAGGIPHHAYMLRDHRAEAKIRTPAQQAQDVANAVLEAGGDPKWAAHLARSALRSDSMQSTLKDADTDELIVDKDGDLATIVREHTRKKKDKDGKPIKVAVQVTPTPQPDETGTPPGLDHGDGGDRSAALHGEHEPLAAEVHVERFPQEDQETGEHAAHANVVADIPRQEHQDSADGSNSDNRERGENSGSFVQDSISEEDALAAQETLMAESAEPLQSSVEIAEPEIEPEAAPEIVAADEPANDKPSADEGGDVEPVELNHDEPLDEGIEEAFASARRRPETDPARLLQAAE